VCTLFSFTTARLEINTANATMTVHHVYMDKVTGTPEWDQVRLRSSKVSY